MASSSQHHLSGKKIGIAGAGIAGLAFVIALRKQWDPTQLGEPPAISIFDRDTRETSVGREGYSLSLAGTDKNAGLYALQQLGLIDQIIEAAIITNEGPGCFKLWNNDFGDIVSLRVKAAPGLPTAAVRIARKDLRRILIDAATSRDTTDIQWDTSCISAQKLDDGKVRARLVRGNGEETEDQDFDLFIAADGASSKIRASLRPDDNLYFTGVVQYGGNARFPDGAIPSPVNQNWGCIMTGRGVFCFVSPVDKHSAVWSVSRYESECRGTLDTSDAAAVQKMLDEALQMGSSIGQPFETLVKATDPETAFILNAKHKKPFAHGDDSLRSIIFIGDSNHAVSPFSGFGANMALMDGWDLAEQLCRSSSIPEALDGYDNKSMQRATGAIKTAEDRIAMGHSSGAKYWMYRGFLGAVGGAMRLFRI